MHFLFSWIWGTSLGRYVRKDAVGGIVVFINDRHQNVGVDGFGQVGALDRVLPLLEAQFAVAIGVCLPDGVHTLSRECLLVLGCEAGLGSLEGHETEKETSAFQRREWKSKGTLGTSCIASPPAPCVPRATLAPSLPAICSARWSRGPWSCSEERRT